ncbi:hypothetical protein [Pedobacter nanyangensis]|uniref:hypothetical protein n=1 Tax=Pedobacter nanyangensis TaxID=1562389 RepID=UPI000DE2BCF0|nr:hypothetical protein [Pedobacter nanyangensis]
MELNIEKTQQLEKLLAKPTLATQEHIPFLQNLIDDYPYFQPLHLLLAKANGAHDNQQNILTKAALYTNGGILHRILHEPQHLQMVEEIEVVTNPAWKNNLQISITAKTVEVAPAAPTVANQSTTTAEVPEMENQEQSSHETAVPEPVRNEEPLTEKTAPQEIIAPEIENLEPLHHEVIAVDHDPEGEKIVAEENGSAATTPQDFVVPEIENLEPLQNEVIKVCEPTPAITNHIPSQQLKETDEQETFEEIGEVALTEEHLSKPETEETIPEVAQQQEPTDLEMAFEQQDEPLGNETGEPIDESLANANFFAFEPSFETEFVVEQEKEVHTETEQTPVQIQKESPNDEVHTPENVVSKYDDDKLPFTFLWWLAKTRKNYEQVFRPFASPAKSSTATQDLQQQYVENIFHIQAPFEPGKEAEVPTTEKPTKESHIIDSFIKNDPQIKALKPHQINNENKAKRSAEDNYDMVSETLAQIYIEQMLYHKAIDTYQKLSLKFPEKSRYFADLIQSLEKKI